MIENSPAKREVSKAPIAVKKLSFAKKKDLTASVCKGGDLMMIKFRTRVGMQIYHYCLHQKFRRKIIYGKYKKGSGLILRRFVWYKD